MWLVAPVAEGRRRRLARNARFDDARKAESLMCLGLPV
jgi:hypothetical protein